MASGFGRIIFSNAKRGSRTLLAASQSQSIVRSSSTVHPQSRHFSQLPQSESECLTYGLKKPLETSSKKVMVEKYSALSKKEEKKMRRQLEALGLSSKQADGMMTVIMNVAHSTVSKEMDKMTEKHGYDIQTTGDFEKTRSEFQRNIQEINSEPRSAYQKLRERMDKILNTGKELWENPDPVGKTLMFVILVQFVSPVKRNW